MTVALNTNVTMTGLDFDVGVKSLNGTIAVDFDITNVRAGHIGLADNRIGNYGAVGGPVAASNQIWGEAQGLTVAGDGSVSFETWFRKDGGAAEMTAIKVGSVGSYKKFRIEQATYGTTRALKIYGLSALGGSATVLLVNETFATGANHDMRSNYFSPFIYGGSTESTIYRCVRKD